VSYHHHQVEAIRSGLNPGLTMVVGPPGTGKTDVAVQVRLWAASDARLLYAAPGPGVHP
jgi:KaiC/GvpD/RAD55 family RecA-like ATPase